MYLIAKDITEGRLINLLPDFEDTSTNIYAVYLMRQNMSPKFVCFLNFYNQVSFSQHVDGAVRDINQDR